MSENPGSDDAGVEAAADAVVEEAEAIETEAAAADESVAEVEAEAAEEGVAEEAESADEAEVVDEAEAITEAAATEEADELADEGEVAADYLEALLDIADLDGDIDISVANGRASLSVIEVNPGDLSELVGENGRVLSALQDLTRLAVARETGERSRLMLDIAGHRATRRMELQRIAKDAIAEAKEAGEPVRMAPMGAFERKVVHDEVAAAGMSSESEGTEPQRYVVITPA